jgi:surface protein
LDFSSVSNLNTNTHTSPVASCKSLTGITMTNTSGITGMYGFFHICNSLTEVNISDTSNVTNMRAMFQNCSSLKEIPSMDTSNVTGMRDMFNGCSSLKEIPSMDTSSVTDVSYLNYGASKLRKIGSLDFSSATSLTYLNRYSNRLNASGIYGIIKTHTYNGCDMTRDNLIIIFNNLGTASSQTIDVRNNPGTGDLTPEDIAIATTKGWTVTV